MKIEWHTGSGESAAVYVLGDDENRKGITWNSFDISDQAELAAYPRAEWQDIFDRGNAVISCSITVQEARSNDLDSYDHTFTRILDMPRHGSIVFVSGSAQTGYETRTFNTAHITRITPRPINKSLTISYDIIITDA